MQKTTRTLSPLEELLLKIFVKGVAELSFDEWAAALEVPTRSIFEWIHEGILISPEHLIDCFGYIFIDSSDQELREEISELMKRPLEEALTAGAQIGETRYASIKEAQDDSPPEGLAHLFPCLFSQHREQFELLNERTLADYIGRPELITFIQEVRSLQSQHMQSFALREATALVCKHTG